MTPEEGKNLRIVAEVMDELELCEGCGVNTEGSSVKTLRADGSLVRLLCHSCSIREKLDQFAKDSVLTGRLIMDSISSQDLDGPRHEIRKSYERLRDRIRGFERRVWFGGLQEEVKRCTRSAMSMKHGTLEVLLFSSAGRTMVTIQDGDLDFTVVAAEDSDKPSMGMQSVTGREAELFGLLDRAEAAWESGVRPVPDDQVSML